MSKLGYISRYSLIVKKLKAKPYSNFKELKNYLETRFEYLQEKDKRLYNRFSKRTLQRDIQDIKSLYKIDIEFSSKEKGYFISNSATADTNFQRMMEAFDLFNSLNLAEDLAPFIYLEKRKPQGTENIHGLLHAIKNKLQIKFEHHKYWEEGKTQRTVEPYALKEFKGRWYLLAKDYSDGMIKSFALDRINNLDITRTVFETSKPFDVAAHYRYSFGIISPNDLEPEDIILSFTALQGRYIKSLPLHETQKTLLDTDTELQVQLKLCVTHDFIMELLSYGSNVKVLQPQSLVADIKARQQEAFMQY